MKKKIIKAMEILQCPIEFIISILLMLNIRKSLVLAYNSEHVRYRTIFLIAVFSIILLIYLGYSIWKNKEKYEKIFLAVMIPIGIFYIMFVLPNTSYDEEEHMYRAYNVSKGNFIAETTEVGIAKTSIPQKIVINNRIDLINSYQKLEEKETENTEYDNEIDVFNSAQGYSPTLYMVTATIFKIGRSMNLNFTKVLCIARICNFIFFLILGYYSIKVIPFGKLLMFTYLFNPMLIYQATSVSADCIINSTIIFYIAYLIKLIKQKEQLTIKNKIIFGISTILVSLAKYVYFPIVLISILLVLKKAKTTKKDKIFIIAICIIGLIFALGWYVISSRYVDIRGYIQEHGVNSREQIKYIITHPINYIFTIFNTLYQYGEKMFIEFLGYRLGPAEIFTSLPCLFLYAVLLLGAIIFEKHTEDFDKKERLVVFINFAITFLLVLTGLYIIWSGVGTNLIEGLQGRYFIPIIILLLLCCIKKGKYIECDFKKVNIIYTILLTIVNIQAIVQIIQNALIN